MTRRMFLTAGAVSAAGVAVAAFGSRWSRSPASSDNAQTPVEGGPEGKFEVMHTEAEWRRILTDDQFAVLRNSATERPFTSALLHETRKGVFACAGCDLDLFSSTTKFDSGTGWPSFWAPIDKAIGTTSDESFGVTRTAVHCRRCGGHLGHVFDDGPKPTGLRYCINGIILKFKSATT